jgi:hypothetical protein
MAGHFYVQICMNGLLVYALLNCCTLFIVLLKLVDNGKDRSKYVKKVKVFLCKPDVALGVPGG